MQLVLEVALGLLDERAQQRRAVAEASVERPLADARRGGDVVHRHAVDPPLVDQARGGAQDALAVAPRVGALASAAGAVGRLGSSKGWSTTSSTLRPPRLPRRPPVRPARRRSPPRASRRLGAREIAVVAEGDVRLADGELVARGCPRRSSEDLADVGLGPDRAEQAGRGADHGDGLARRPLSGNGPRGPVERVLEHARDRPVELGRGDEHAVGPGDRLAQVRDRLGRAGPTSRSAS